MTEKRDAVGLVILDVLMPKMSGPELRRRLREMGITVQVLYVSGLVPNDLDTSADVLLMKPFSNTELLGSVQSLLAPKRTDAGSTPP
jgi:FixJ family two-component response regulator